MMADHDIEGQLHVLLRLLTSPEWYEKIWGELDLRVESFASLGIAANPQDAELWEVCQAREIVLITGKRNQESPASLEATIQIATTPESLPVLTIGELQRMAAALGKRLNIRLLPGSEQRRSA
jgi:hypothetical protein